jgi:DDE superfamily endonuclease
MEYVQRHVDTSGRRSIDLVATMESEEEDRRRRRKFLFLVCVLRRKRRVRFRNLLTIEGKRRRERKLPRCALPNPTESPWQKVFESKDDGSLITVTGFDFTAFNALVAVFRPFFEGYTPWTGKQDGLTFKQVVVNEKYKGKARLITAESCLGLVLAWYRFRGPEYILQGWFGFTGCHTNVWLRFGRRMLLKSLISHPLAKVEMPNAANIEKLKAIVHARHSVLEDVYCTCDGLKLHFQKQSGLDEQSMFYNGWVHGHYVTNLFVFAADGRIIATVLNAPGSLHDSTLAQWGGIYNKLEQCFIETGGICCVDSAFAANNNPYLIKSSQDTTRIEGSEEFRKAVEATSLRQASEWGMRAIQSAFPRLKDAIKYEENGERKRILKLVPLLYNYRLEIVGLNQIRNTYVPLWSKDGDNIVHK